MSLPYRIFGAELSPYSVKVRSYFRYKQIPHEWIVRSLAVQDEFKKYAKLPLIPVVATPEDEGLQDSTPILEEMERRFPEPALQPTDPALAFLSALLEEFGDEWGNKWMFHYRWAREVDQQSAGARLARTMTPDAPDDQIAGMAQGIVERMVGRVYFVGSNERTAPQIEASFEQAMQQLEAHLAREDDGENAGRKYLFGGRPCMADFGLWGQIYNAWTDPTCGKILEDRPNVVAWIERMQSPKVEGDFEPWDALESTLVPFLTDQVGARFLPWSTANARALAEGRDEFEVDLAGQSYDQKPQKYHARSLKTLRERYAAVVDKRALDPILERTGCLSWLTS